MVEDTDKSSIPDLQTEPTAEASIVTPTPDAPATDGARLPTGSIKTRSEKRPIFDVSNHALIGGMITAIISAALGAFISYILTNQHSESGDREAAISVKQAIATECVVLKTKFKYMVDDAKGYYMMNSYLLPRFPENLVSAVNYNTTYYLSTDKKFPVSSFSEANYQTTMATRTASDDIFGSPLWSYVAAINHICRWSTSTQGDYIDMKPFRPN